MSGILTLLAIFLALAIGLAVHEVAKQKARNTHRHFGL